MNQKNKLIVKQALRILELEDANARLRDSAQRHYDWTYQAKKDAGYDNDISFDTIWTEVLAKGKVNGTQS